MLKIPDELRADLIRYLVATSAERAGIIGELIEQNPSMAGLLVDLEADDDLRAKLEIALLRLGRIGAELFLHGMAGRTS